LVESRDEFDDIFPGHSLVDLGTIMLVNILEACDRVIADPECDEKAEVTFDGKTRVRYNKMIYQSGYLIYFGKFSLKPPPFLGKSYLGKGNLCAIF
jgi:hypothetical protein